MSLLSVALAVGEASLRASPVLIAVLVLRRVIASRTNAAPRRALLLATVLAVPALPGMGVLLPGVALSPPAPVALSRIAMPEAAAAGSKALPALSGGMAAVWLLGAAVMLARLMAGLVEVHRRARAATTLKHPAWLADRDTMAAALGLARTPELRLSSLECMPYVCGWARQIVVLPRSAMDWPTARRRAVLAHEIGHLARREPVARVAAELVRAIHWFDPLLRRAVAQFRRESELTADEAALGLGIDPREYADHLVRLARERLSPVALRAVPGFAAPGELERRVECLLTVAPSEVRHYGGRRLARAAIPALALGLVALMAVPRIVPQGSPLDRWSERYGIPVGLAGEILTTAEREGIEPGVAFGLVAEESDFDAERISARGAVGLTQVLPSTARLVEPGLSLDELRDDSINLQVGFRYLRVQIERERGSVVNGLLAYALGPGRLDDLRDSGEPVPLDYPARVLTHMD